MPTLRIGHSPDPDDAFMYYALAHGKVSVGSYQTRHVLEEIESLNRRALTGDLEVTAISTAAYPHVAEQYRIMRVGSSIGRDYGPIVVSRTDHPLTQLAGARVAVPGLHTTAYLLLRLYQDDFEAVPMAFDSILPAIQEGRVDAGLLIHEGQLTYKGLGLTKIVDLGETWGQDTGLPIPLGLDMVRRDLGEEVASLMTQALRQSILYAFEHEEDALAYAVQFGRGVEVETCRRFVHMYVNQDTLDMGEEGVRALETLFSRAEKRGFLPFVPPLDLI